MAGQVTGQDLCLLGNPGQLLPAKAEDAFCSVIFDGVLYNRADLSEYSNGSLTENDAVHSVKSLPALGRGRTEQN